MEYSSINTDVGDYYIDKNICLHMINVQLDLSSMDKLMEKIDKISIMLEEDTQFVKYMIKIKDKFIQDLISHLWEESNNHIHDSPSLCKRIRRLKTYTDYSQLFSDKSMNINSNEDWFFEYINDNIIYMLKGSPVDINTHITKMKE